MDIRIVMKVHKEDSLLQFALGELEWQLQFASDDSIVQH